MPPFFYRLALFLLLGLTALPGWADLSDAEAVNLSGLQRMLSQRIAKDYLMIASEVRPDLAASQLEESLAHFESNLLALQAYTQARSLDAPLQQVTTLWQRYRQQVEASPSQTAALTVLDLSDELLSASEALVQRIEQQSSSPTSGLVNRSGRQRMLSQRIAALYLALSWQLPRAGLQEQFEQAVTEFGQTLEVLGAAPQNSPAIHAALAKANAQWAFSKRGFELSGETRYVPTLISTTCDNLFERMHSLTLAYADLPERNRLP